MWWSHGCGVTSDNIYDSSQKLPEKLRSDWNSYGNYTSLQPWRTLRPASPFLIPTSRSRNRSRLSTLTVMTIRSVWHRTDLTPSSRLDWIGLVPCCYPQCLCFLVNYIADGPIHPLFKRSYSYLYESAYLRTPFFARWGQRVTACLSSTVCSSSTTSSGSTFQLLALYAVLPSRPP